MESNPGRNLQSDVRYHLHLEADASWAKGGTKIVQITGASQSHQVKKAFHQADRNGSLAMTER
jgi:hypothetical protein